MKELDTKNPIVTFMMIINGNIDSTKGICWISLLLKNCNLNRMCIYLFRIIFCFVPCSVCSLQKTKNSYL